MGESIISRSWSAGHGSAGGSARAVDPAVPYWVKRANDIITRFLYKVMISRFANVFY